MRHFHKNLRFSKSPLGNSVLGYRADKNLPGRRRYTRTIGFPGGLVGGSFGPQIPGILKNSTTLYLL